MICLDTSALLKLVLAEDRSDALRAFPEQRRPEQTVSSVLLTRHRPGLSTPEERAGA